MTETRKKVEGKLVSHDLQEQHFCCTRNRSVRLTVAGEEYDWQRARQDSTKRVVARIGKKISKFRQQHNRQTRQVLQQEHYCGSVTEVDNNNGF